MKKNYTVSLEIEVVEELKDKYGFKLSENISIMLIEKLKELSGKDKLARDTEAMYPQWYSTISFKTYGFLTKGEKPEFYWKILEENYGAINREELLKYLNDKYKRTHDNTISDIKLDKDVI